MEYKSKQKSESDFYSRVYDMVREIPFGKVTTYGHIAKALGLRSSARMVGWALNAVAGDTSIPCHRVINRNGELTGRMYFAYPSMMRELLENEGIEFKGERVNLDKHMWEPGIK